MSPRPGPANGIAPNLLTTTILASPKLVVVCPNVNDAMRKKGAVRRNVEMLREDGHIAVEPDLAMVCEVDTGERRESWVVSEPEKLVELLREILHRPEFSASGGG